MKRLIVLSLFVVLLTVAHTADAHILKTDGSIGVLLHLTPDDDPIVGQPASFFFEIKDKNNKFDPGSCVCAIAIYNQDNKVFSSDLFISNLNNINSSAFSYTFPQKSIYKVVVSGMPKTNDSFQAFNVEFDLRISRDATGSESSTGWLIGLGFIGLALIIASIIYFKGR